MSRELSQGLFQHKYAFAFAPTDKSPTAWCPLAHVMSCASKCRRSPASTHFVNREQLARNRHWSMDALGGTIGQIL
eukprot:4012135-Amphidinium_carterae.1